MLEAHTSAGVNASASSASSRRKRFRWADSNPDVGTGCVGATRSGRSRPMSRGWIPRRLILFSLIMGESRVVTLGRPACLNSFMVTDVVL